MPIDSIDHFTLERSAAGENGPWPTMWTIADKTTTTAPFTVPDKTLPTPDVTVNVADASWIAVDEYLNITLAGLFKVVGKNGNQIALRYLNESYNTRSGELIASGSQVLPGSTVDTDVPSPTFWYKLTGYTVNGITIPYNVMSVTNTVVENGAWKWNIKLGGTLAGDTCFVLGSNIDFEGNIVIVGRFTGTIRFIGTDGVYTDKTGLGTVDNIFVAKYSSAGILRWVNVYGSTKASDPNTHGVDFGTGVTTDSIGNVILTGYFTYTINFGGSDMTPADPTQNDIFLVKLSGLDGSHLWSNHYGLAGPDYGHAIAADSNNNIFLTGACRGAVDFGGLSTPVNTSGGDDVFLAKFNSSGVCQWAHAWGGSGNDVARGIAIDHSDNIWIIGSYFGSINFGGSTFTTTGQDCFFAHFANADGSHLFSRQIFSDNAQGLGISVNASNDVYITGTLGGSSNFGGGTLPASVSSAIFLARYNSSGGYIDAKKYGGQAGGGDTGFSIAFQNSDDFVLVGAARGTIYFGGDFALTSSGATDAFIVKFSKDNPWVHRWSKRFKSNQFSRAFYASAWNTFTNQFVCVGIFGGTVDYGGGTLDSGPSWYNGCIVAFGP